MALLITDVDQSPLDRIKTRIRRSHDYFQPNYDRYNLFRRFVFESALTADDITLLITTGRPQLEFNVLEAYISRLLGEFSKQEPDVEVSSDDQSDDPLNAITVKVVEAHLRHVLTDNNNHHTKYEVYKDLLSGGFSGLKVTTAYKNPMSFDQKININRVYDPTLCGFDQLASYSHKGDGRFCYELFPKSKEEFEEEFPDINIKDISFKRGFEGFNWSYQNDSTPIILVGDYYEKKVKEETIVLLRDNKVMTQKKYKEMLKTWGSLEAPPTMIGKPRKTNIERIERYQVIENQIIKHEQTDFNFLPLIFVDGNSVLIKTPKDGNIRQVCRPYVYHAMGAQKLKNYAGISWANEIENTVQHKFMVAKEALPKEEDFLKAYTNVQQANVMVYNSVYEGNPEQPINNPIREIQRVPCPPEIMQAFTESDKLIQNILGSYDASLGINDNQLSGIALVEAATQSNAAAMPYIVGYLQGYQRAAQVYVDLMPKYYTTPRTIPVIDKEGRKEYVKINQEGGLPMENAYEENVLNVNLKAGASFQVQKSRTIMMIKEMMGMSPLFAQFIAEKGLNFVLDNMEGKGIDQLKVLVDGWLREMQAQKQAAMQQQQQNPAMMKVQLDQQRLQHDIQKDNAEYQLDMKKIEVEEKRIDADLHMAEQDASVDLVKANTERYAKKVDLEMSHYDMTHRHFKEALELHHKVNQPIHHGA